MVYTKTTWQDDPSTATPLSAANLNHLETQYDEAVATLGGGGGGGGHWLPRTPVYAEASGHWTPGRGHYGAGTNTALALGTAHAVPFVLAETLTADAVGIWVTTAVASSTVRLALFDTGASGWLPGALIEDFGTLSAANTGTVSITLPGGPRVLTADTLYWVAFESEVGAPTLKTGVRQDYPSFPFNTSLSENIGMGGRIAHTWARTAGPFSGAWGGTQGGSGTIFDFAWRMA